MHCFIRKIFVVPFRTAKPSPGISIFYATPHFSTYICLQILDTVGFYDYFPDRLLIESSMLNRRKPYLHRPAIAATESVCLHSLFLCCPCATTTHCTEVINQKQRLLRSSRWGLCHDRGWLSSTATHLHHCAQGLHGTAHGTAPQASVLEDAERERHWGKQYHLHTFLWLVGMCLLTPLLCA